MAYSTHPNSKLRYWATGAADWLDDMNWNLARLNDVLLRLGDGTSSLGVPVGLLDVDATAGGGVADNDVLRYNGGTGKFEPWTPPVTFATTTTTTTTTSTTTTA